MCLNPSWAYHVAFSMLVMMIDTGNLLLGWLMCYERLRTPRLSGIVATPAGEMVTLT